MRTEKVKGVGTAIFGRKSEYCASNPSDGGIIKLMKRASNFTFTPQILYLSG
jgi:hypothetical protein